MLGYILYYFLVFGYVLDYLIFCKPLLIEALLPAPVDRDLSLSGNYQKPQAAAFSFAVYKEGSEKASFFLSELKT